MQLVASKSQRLEDVGEEQELDLEEETTKPRIADLIEHNYYFREVRYFNRCTYDSFSSASYCGWIPCVMKI